MEEAVKRCPFCKELILKDAVKCKHCHEWLDGRKVQPAIMVPQKPQYSNAQDPKKFVTVTLLSFFLYLYYWYFRSWRYLRDFKGLDISPLGRTIGASIPIVSIFLDYSLFTKIREFAEDTECKADYSPGLLTFFSGVLSIIGWTLVFLKYLTKDPIVYFFSEAVGIILACIAIAIPYIVQVTINSIWFKKQPKLKIREKYSDGEIIVIIAGVFLWLYWFFGLIKNLLEKST